MKLSRIFLFIFVLPVTLFLDFILYAILQTCPGCSTFSGFLKTEGALSFPFVIELTEWIHRVIKNSLIGKKL
ncbi:hypothetical protein A3D77_01395 [Candidatus Gottesmanbacteria bacterium RIFCSPHIGHO2_02_FULL_39_11]|uniref:Uncharacterized protein n=1 Tax=Candidatus Gottesmanbacteria bacterium RIFCSPHIGHO2_02_FULL_39_11 TaxID=1798382 RepID=A0A1F5ZTK3_9BACT|nr:MAG: hypothetical protein A3D77_01395 [Candidatus Gottesmanbacteria bacterium RIFCSPHIGHO2_02_FULL_39_11]